MFLDFPPLLSLVFFRDDFFFFFKALRWQALQFISLLCPGALLMRQRGCGEGVYNL